MFGKRFAYQFQQGRGREWTPPWGPRGWHGPRFFGMRPGRGPFGHGGPFGMRRGPFGPGGEGHRFFGRGDVKFALLELLQERPMHGYEMMKALEERSAGFYTPSPGSIYPTLQMLEDRGFVIASEAEGKKVYSITDAGRALLAERQKTEEDFAGPPWMRHHGPGGHHRPEVEALRVEGMEVVRLLTIAARMSFKDQEQLVRLRSIIERTRKELTDMIYGAGSTESQAASPAANQSEGPTIDQV